MRGGSQRCSVDARNDFSSQIWCDFVPAAAGAVAAGSEDAVVCAQ